MEGPNRRSKPKQRARGRCYKCGARVGQEQRYYVVRRDLDGCLTRLEPYSHGHSLNKHKGWELMDEYDNEKVLTTPIMPRFPTVNEQRDGKLKGFQLWQRKDSGWTVGGADKQSQEGRQAKKLKRQERTQKTKSARNNHHHTTTVLKVEKGEAITNCSSDSEDSGSSSSEGDLLLVVGATPNNGPFNSKELCVECSPVHFPIPYAPTRFICAWSGWRDEVSTPLRHTSKEIDIKNRERKKKQSKTVYLDDL